MLMLTHSERRAQHVFGPFALVTLAAVLLSGCASIPKVKPEYTAMKPSDLGLAPSDGSPAKATPVVADVPVAGEWWHALDDPQLDRIMADALAGSPTLDTAMARLRLMQAGVDIQRAGLLPHVGVDGSESYQRLSEHYIYPSPLGGTSRWFGSVQANLTWNLDLAGKQKALISAQRGQAYATALDIEAARVTLSGSVAQAYINLARAEQQADIAARFVGSRQQSVGIAATRKRAGLASDFEIRSSETLLAEAKQAQVRAIGARETMVHALAALAGKGADYYATIGRTHVDLASALPVPATLPIDLLGRRADILAARAQIDSADALRRYARAQFFPDVNLSAFAGLQAIGLGNLVNGGSRAYGGGPAIHLPIFEGGQLRAEYKASVAYIDQQIASYNGLVVRAVQEAADALSAIGTNAADAEQQGAIVQGLSRTVHLDEVRERSGLGARLDVLGAGDRLLQADEKRTDIAADGAVQRVQLLIAIGGSFDPAHYTAADARPIDQASAGKPTP